MPAPIGPRHISTSTSPALIRSGPVALIAAIATASHFGGRSQSYQRVFRDARDTVKSELKEQAEALGAHAVVATRFTYNQLDGTSGGMVMVAAVGTAVRLAPRG